MEQNKPFPDDLFNDLQHLTFVGNFRERFAKKGGRNVNKNPELSNDNCCDVEEIVKSLSYDWSENEQIWNIETGSIDNEERGNISMYPETPSPTIICQNRSQISVPEETLKSLHLYDHTKKSITDDTHYAFESSKFTPDIKIAETEILDIIYTELVLKILEVRERRPLTQNDMKINETNPEVALFYHSIQADFSLRDYIGVLMNKFDCSVSVMIFAVIYMERIAYTTPLLALSIDNVSRLFLSALIVARKYLEDVQLRNTVCAYHVELDTNVLNQLESNFLSLLGWNLNVSRESFQEYLTEMVHNYYNICAEENTGIYLK